MFTPREIRDTAFDKAVRGYNPDDVDAFLAQLADQIETLEAEKNDAESKMMMLAEKLEGYRKDEDTLRSALITSERLKEAVLTEARQKSEILISDAQMKADQIMSAANQELEQEEEAFDILKKEVSGFKRELLGMYKKHLELINQMPEDGLDDVKYEEKAAEDEPKDPVVPKAAEATIEEDVDAPEEPTFEDAPEEEKQPSLFASFESEEESADKEEKKAEEIETKFGKLDFGDNFSFDK